MECIGHMQIYFLILRQCLQRSVFAETVDNVFCSSLCDAGDVQIKFLHSVVVLQSIPQLQTPLRTQVVAAHTVHRSRKHILCVLLISKNVKVSKSHGEKHFLWQSKTQSLQISHYSPEVSLSYNCKASV